MLNIVNVELQQLELHLLLSEDHRRHRRMGNTVSQRAEVSVTLTMYIYIYIYKLNNIDSNNGTLISKKYYTMYIYI